MANSLSRSRSSRSRHLSLVGTSQSSSEKLRSSQSQEAVPVQAPPSRLLIVWGVLILSGLGLIANLFRLQVIQAPVLMEKAQQQQTVYLRPFVPRRPIVDRNGNFLAVDQPMYTLYAHPKLFKEPKITIANKLSSLVNQSPTQLFNKFNQAESGIQIEFSLSESVADRITDLSLDGLELIQHQQRLYPQQELAADVVGYVNLDRQGQAGVEYNHQNLLERSVRVVRVNRTGTGNLIPDQAPGGFLHLDDLRLQLTLDLQLQRTARSLLREQMSKYQAKRGAVIVMDARDGSLLSLASEPSYDPNRYSKYDLSLFKNWTITDLYEPGSTFKPLNVAIALEAKAIQPDDVFYDEGRIIVNGWPIENYDFSYRGVRGPLSVSEILQNSSNVGMVHIIQQMKRGIYYGWLERLGLGQKSGVDLPFEISSQLKNQELFINSAIEPTTTAFGQGFSLTPMQLVQMHGALANGGRLVTPHVVRGLLDTNGQLHWRPNLPPARRVFSPKTSRTVLEMMEKVVTQGTGKSAHLPGYRIGGKTGTAQKANPNGGYYSNAKITSFVAVFPIESPRYVILAVIDEPKGDNAFGSTVAAPIVRSMIETLVLTEGIPPNQSASVP